MNTTYNKIFNIDPKQVKKELKQLLREKRIQNEKDYTKARHKTAQAVRL
jgi:excinuclease UvrABC helicase subunit UvrB